MKVEIRLAEIYTWKVARNENELYRSYEKESKKIFKVAFRKQKKWKRIKGLSRTDAFLFFLNVVQV